MKFYRYGMTFYKIMADRFERVTAYHHCQAIEIQNGFKVDMEGLTEISESQYNRVKRLILKTLI